MRGLPPPPSFHSSDFPIKLHLSSLFFLKALLLVVQEFWHQSNSRFKLKINSQLLEAESTEMSMAWAGISAANPCS